MNQNQSKMTVNMQLSQAKTHPISTVLPQNYEILKFFPPKYAGDDGPRIIIEKIREKQRLRKRWQRYKLCSCKEQ